MINPQKKIGNLISTFIANSRLQKTGTETISWGCFVPIKIGQCFCFSFVNCMVVTLKQMKLMFYTFSLY